MMKQSLGGLLDYKNELYKMFGFNSAHKEGVRSENAVNGNTRGDKSIGQDENVFTDNNGCKTQQTITPNETTGGVTIIKTEIP